MGRVRVVPADPSNVLVITKRCSLQFAAIVNALFRTVGFHSVPYCWLPHCSVLLASTLSTFINHYWHVLIETVIIMVHGWWPWSVKLIWNRGQYHNWLIIIIPLYKQGQVIDAISKCWEHILMVCQRISHWLIVFRVIQHWSIFTELPIKRGTTWIWTQDLNPDID